MTDCPPVPRCILQSMKTERHFQKLLARQALIPQALVVKPNASRVRFAIKAAKTGQALVLLHQPTLALRCPVYQFRCPRLPLGLGTYLINLTTQFDLVSHA
ncbi:hypothetical protein PtB15_11B399 [Puccinia triticina]|nr:hypothetical protein PtB15_11B399 [Puccinia triticina]